MPRKKISPPVEQPRDTTCQFWLTEAENALLRRALATTFDGLTEINRRYPYLAPETDVAITAERDAVLALWKRLSDLPNGET